MMLIRPVAREDLAKLTAFAGMAGVGLTSLPLNEVRLEQRVARSEQSFTGALDEVDRGYVFVLEDSDAGVVAGICAIEAAVGLKEAWYNYRVGTIVHASEQLGVYSRHDTLFLSNDHTGFTELCTLFLHSDYRVNRNGALLSKSRFLFLAQFAPLFSRTVIAEMRGVSDQHGRSPFWEALGRHFFSIDFAQADYLTGVGQKAFVAELMPKYPIYIDFLPSEAQAVIGVPHENTRPAYALLASEGFRYQGYVDIFDAGPTIQAYADEIRAVKESRSYHAKVINSKPLADTTLQYLVSNTSQAHFRVILACADLKDNVFPLTHAEAEALEVNDGELVRVATVSVREGRR